MAKNDSLTDLLSLVQKVDPEAEILAESPTADVKEWIGTGSYILNAGLSGSLFKGIPSGRITVCSGPSGCGKSYLMNSIAREAQVLGYTPIIIDTENAIDNDFCKRLGVDTSNLIIKKCTTVSEMSNFVLGICKHIEAQKPEDRQKVIILLDSLSNLSSDAELENVENSNIHKQDFTKNKGLKAFFRTATTILGKLSIPMLISSHVYACLTGDTEIKTKEGLKPIKNVSVGDIVETKDGFNSVVKTFVYHNAPVFHLEFEDGTSIKCTEEHKLLVSRNNQQVYIPAKDLIPGDEIVLKEYDSDRQANTLKITNISRLEKTEDVYDIEVKDEHNFILKNNVVSSNSVGSFFPTQVIQGGEGLKYSASTILMLSTAKLDGDNKENDNAAKKSKADITKTGVRVTAKVEKSRFAIPTKVQFQIPFFKEINPYVGLENFLTFENSGIGRGNVMTESEYNRAKESDKKQMTEFVFEDKKLYFNPSDRARGMVVAHLGKQVPFTEFYTKEVFTKELLEKLDKEIIRPTFELPSHGSNADIAEYISDTSESNDTEE